MARHPCEWEGKEALPWKKGFPKGNPKKKKKALKKKDAIKERFLKDDGGKWVGGSSSTPKRGQNLTRRGRQKEDYRSPRAPVESARASNRGRPRKKKFSESEKEDLRRK